MAKRKASNPKQIKKPNQKLTISRCAAAIRELLPSEGDFILSISRRGVTLDADILTEKLVVPLNDAELFIKQVEIINTFTLSSIEDKCAALKESDLDKARAMLAEKFPLLNLRDL